MPERTEFYCFVVLCLINVLLSAIAQVFLKKGAQQSRGSILKDYFNIYVITGYGIYLMTTVLGVLIYKILPLSLGTVLDSTGYFWVTMFSILIFKEKISKRKMLAILIIIAGVIIYGI